MITFSGTDFRNLKNDKSISFSLNDASLSNITGSGSFGFSGNSYSSSFKYKKGKLFDPEGRFFYSYDSDETFDLSGNFNESSYDYYVNKEPYCFSGVRANFKVQNFFVKTSGTNLSVENIDVYSREARQLAVSFPARFDLSGTTTGQISNSSSTYALDVFTGSVVDPTGNFELISISKTGLLQPNNSVDFVLSNTQGGLGVVYDIDLLFNTSAGDLERTKTSKASCLNAYDQSTFTEIFSVTQSGHDHALSSMPSHDSGLFFFDNYKALCSGSGVAGDNYSVMLKFNNDNIEFSHTGSFYGFTGAYVIVSGGSGYHSSLFNITGASGSASDGGFGKYRTNSLGAITGLKFDRYGQNHFGNIGVELRNQAFYGVTGNLISSGNGANIVLGKFQYTKKFWDTWSLHTGSSLGSLEELNSASNIIQSVPMYSGVPIREDFFVMVKAKNWYDSRLQITDLIVSGVDTGKIFSKQLTGIL